MVHFSQSYASNVLWDQKMIPFSEETLKLVVILKQAHFILDK